jgi:hypothetical protein
MTPTQRAYALVALVAIALMALFHTWGYGPLYVLLVAAGAAIVIIFVPRWIIAFGERTHEGLNRQVWKDAEGRHHAFAGVGFTMVDDGRHVWMHADALKRVLSRPEADDVLAARISGKWKHDERQQLWLRVDAVVEHLATFPGRMDPRVQKLRRWLERDVLFPAARRHDGRHQGR